MNCKENDLAIVVNGHCPCAKRNIGAIVRCMNVVQTEGGPLWLVMSETHRMLVFHEPDDVFPYALICKEAVHFDAHLKPIRPEEAKDDMGLFESDIMKAPLTKENFEKIF